jgi:hypothetical protein
MAGDLARAKASAEELAAAATDIAEHGEALVEIDEEMSRVDDAGKIAFDFFRRQELCGAYGPGSDRVSRVEGAARKARVGRRRDQGARRVARAMVDPRTEWRAMADGLRLGCGDRR